MDKNEAVLDLSNTKLKKLNKASTKENQCTELILDDNQLQRLDNIDSFSKLQKLSACRNQLLRMYGVCRLQNLQILNLSNNGILMIEGLKELSMLKWLSLAGNSIKTIEHLHTNINLEHLDLSENAITHISDLSFLKNLKELFLHKNKINHLGQCDRFLPISLTTLTLSSNNIGDLNEISRLSHLTNLTKISIANNPCVNMTGGNNVGFDYRPFIINWCLNVNVIDNYAVDAIESLRAEWLYSQGRGRHFRIGDQKELTQYLATVCPLTGEKLETEEDRKLRVILSKAQHHQQQLREQSLNGSPQPSPVTKKKFQLNKNSPRLNSLKLGNRIKSPDQMSSSCYITNSETNSTNSPVMSQSLDPAMFRQTVNAQNKEILASSTNLILEKYHDCEPINSPLQAVTKMVPVPETLMSPDYRPMPLLEKSIRTLSAPPQVSICSTPIRLKQSDSIKSPKFNRIPTPKHQQMINNYDPNRKPSAGSPSCQRKTMSPNLNKNDNRKQSILRNKSPTSEDESELYDSKLHMIQMKIEEKRQQKDMENNKDKVQQAAIYIQKIWRGYYTRNKNKEVQEIFRTLQNQRATQYIEKLASDMETTKAALESERKIQMLQTEAIGALWKKISSLNCSSSNEEGCATSMSMTNLTSNNTEVVRELSQTCSLLQSQIKQLQNSMEDVVKVMAAFSSSTNLTQHLKENGIATQTEIVAVHTPQGEAAKVFPFQKSPQQQLLQQSRPSSLPLPINQRKKDTNTTQINAELRQFAGSLVDGVIRTAVSEKSADSQETQQLIGDLETELEVINDLSINCEST